MTKRNVFALLAVGAVGIALAGCANSRAEDQEVALAASQPAMGPEASINFASTGGIYNWRAASDDVMFIEGRDRKWYRADMLGPCFGMDRAFGVKFLPGIGGDTFDHFSAIEVDGQKCNIRSLKVVDPPYARARMRGDGAKS